MNLDFISQIMLYQSTSFKNNFQICPLLKFPTLPLFSKTSRLSPKFSQFLPNNLTGPTGGSLLRWLIMFTWQTKNKFTVTLETDQIAQMTFCFPTGTYLLKAMRPPDSRPPAMRPQDSTTGWKLAISSEKFSLVGFKKGPDRKGGCWFSLRGSHPLFSL